MKKILSIFAIVCLLAMVAPSVFAATCGGTTDGDCPVGPPAQHCVTAGGPSDTYSCSYCSSYCASPRSCFLTGTSYVCEVPPVNPLLSGPGECIKIKSDFMVRLRLDGTTKVEVQFNSGQIIAAADGTTKVSCPMMTGSSITQPCTATGGATVECYMPQPNQIGVVGMLNVIYTVTNWIFYILTLLAVLFIIYGGFTYLTSSGDPTKSAKGKSILTYAIIGLSIALLAKFVPSLVKFIIGV